MSKRRKYSKPVSYYVLSFITAVVAVLVYGLYVNRSIDSAYWEWVLEHSLYPFFITLLVFLFHTFGGRTKERVDRQNKEQIFVLDISKAVKEELDLDPEVVVAVRDNPKFQDALFKAYQIYLYGENTTLNYNVLESMFENDSVEHKAIEIIVRKVQEMRKDEKNK